jgi:hypothetical protein
MKKKCIDHFHDLVATKINAIKFKADLSASKKLARDIVKSKEWRSEVKALTEVAKKFQHLCRAKDSGKCVIG